MRNSTNKATLSQIWSKASFGCGVPWDSVGIRQPEQCQGEVMRLSHAEIDHVILQANQQLGGNWRLPTLAELESIVCLECPAPKIDAGGVSEHCKRALLDIGSELDRSTEPLERQFYDGFKIRQILSTAAIGWPSCF
jgi:hypothetical protein